MHMSREHSGRLIDSRPMGRGFEPYRHHCVVSLRHIYPCIVLVQPREARPDITEQVAQWATIAHLRASIMLCNTIIYDALRQITLNLKQ